MRRVFFGWWVLTGIFLVYFASNGILLNTLPLFYPELIKEFGWNEEQVTRPAAVFFAVSAALSPVFGALLDRYSARAIMMFGSVCLFGALAAYPFVTELRHLVSIYVAFGIGLSGCGLVTSMLLITRWFARFRGIAVGIFLMSSSLGGAVFPLVARQTLIDSGWRDAVLLLTLVGGLLMILPVLIAVRNSPQSLGLEPDGGPAPDTGQRATQRKAAVAYTGTLRAALKTPVFYLLAFSTATLWFCIVGMLQHQSIYLGQDIGIDRATLPIVFSVFFWAAIVGKLTFGWLSDYYAKSMIMLLAILTLAIGLAALFFITPDSITPAYAYALIYGIGYSGAFTMIQLMIAEIYAGPSYGKILGVFAFVDTMAGAMGTQVVGMVRVSLESYLPAFSAMIIMCLVAAGCIALIGRLSERNTGADGFT